MVTGWLGRVWIWRASLVSSAGVLLLRATARAIGVDRALSTALAPWRADRATHDPGKVILDLASAVALGGDCLADLAVLRAQPALFGLVASDPTVSRLIPRPAGISGTRDGGVVIVDLDSTLVTAHSDKEPPARPTGARGTGLAWKGSDIDPSAEGTRAGTHRLPHTVRLPAGSVPNRVNASN